MAKIRDLFISILLISTQVFSQNLETKLIKNLPSNLSPGSSNTIVFRISNNNEHPVSLNTKLSAPTNWRLFYNETVTIQEKSVTILPIGVMIPLTTQPGFYQIILELNNSEINYKKIINVDTYVLKRIDIEVKFHQDTIAGHRVQLGQINNSLAKYTELDRVSKGLKKRAEFKAEIETLNSLITDQLEAIRRLEVERAPWINKKNLDEIKLGPVKYLVVAMIIAPHNVPKKR